jgi:hypothetical protein
VQRTIKHWAVLLFLTWSATVYAATHGEVAFGRDLASIPVAAFLITAILSGIGGAASTLQRLSSAPDLSRWKLEVAKDLVCAIVAGLVTFFFCESQAWSSAAEAGAITVAGYGSSKVLDLFLSRFTQQVGDAKS